jgi:hypothetical protein
MQKENRTPATKDNPVTDALIAVLQFPFSQKVYFESLLSDYKPVKAPKLNNTAPPIKGMCMKSRLKTRNKQTPLVSLHFP